MIDVRRLRALRELADRGTVVAAAEALHLTPSAVSQQLSALEREVGSPLLEPDGRGVRLTPAAHVLLDHAHELFAQLERLEADLAAQATEAAGVVRIGAFATAVRGLAVPAAIALRASAPALRLQTTEVEGHEAFLGLARGTLDLVISMEGPDAPRAGDARLVRRELLRDDHDAVVPAGHPLAARASVRLGDLAGETWVAAPPGWLCESVLLGGCRAEGFTPRIEHRSGDWATTVALVAAGLCVALLPRLAEMPVPPGAVLRPLTGLVPARHVFAACRRGAEDGPAIAPVLDALAAVSESRRTSWPRPAAA